MPRYGIAPQLSSHWFPQGSAHESPDVCKRGCCWSPYGHSSAAVGCHCHEEQVIQPSFSEGKK